MSKIVKIELIFQKRHKKTEMLSKKGLLFCICIYYNVECYVLQI